MSDGQSEGLEEDVDALIGRTIAEKFVVERRLGAGAMGAVYRAQQTALDRVVAIKVMHGGLAGDATYAERFHLEARAVSRLDHPNLIHVIDFGQEADGLLYIAMEYLDCRDLLAILAEDWPLEHGRIVDLLSQTLSGLAAAHDAGVLHRDLKPENIVVVRRKGEDGTPVEIVKVCDFGIAKLVDGAGDTDAPARGGRRKLTTAGLVVGTPEYMSPEQAQGGTFDVRSDLYALGVVLYQLLTRRLPFEAKTAIEIVFKAIHDEPARLDAEGPTAAPGLDAICLKAMSRRPEDRYATAREMRAALRAAPEVATRTAARPARSTSPDAPTLPFPAQPPAPEERGTSAALPATKTPRWGARGALGFMGAAAIAAVFVATRRAPPSQAATTPPPAPVASSSPGAWADAPAPSALATRSLPDERAASVVPPPSAAPEPSSRALPAATRSPAQSRRPAGDRAPPAVAAPIVPSADATVASQVPLVVAAIAAPSAAPSTPPSTPPAQPSRPPPPSFDLQTARVEVGQAKSNSAAISSSNVGRALAPVAPRFTSCYRNALAQGVGASGEIVTSLHLESDGDGYITLARLSGDAPAGAARCIEGVVRTVHVAVDTGTANADVVLTFEPR